MITIQNLYADLLANATAASLGRSLPAGSSVYRVMRKGREYCYAKLPDKTSRYLGRADRVGEFLEREADFRKLDDENKALVRALKANGAMTPPPQACRVLAALSDAGFFRLRATLVGTCAFQTYMPMLGMRPSPQSMTTGDIDIAKFRSIAIAIGESPERDIGDILKACGAFERAPSMPHMEPSASWIDRRTGLSVDALSPLHAPYDEDFGDVPGLGRTEKLKFLDFLIYGEIPAVIPHGSGIAVNVPEPARFAVHKLLVAAERKNPAKRRKDVMQAQLLIDALLTDSPSDLKAVFGEAWSHPGFRKRLRKSLPLLPDNVRMELAPAESQ